MAFGPPRGRGGDRGGMRGRGAPRGGSRGSQSLLPRLAIVMGNRDRLSAVVADYFLPGGFGDRGGRGASRGGRGGFGDRGGRGGRGGARGGRGGAKPGIRGGAKVVIVSRVSILSPCRRCTTWNDTLDEIEPTGRPFKLLLPKVFRDD